jgi:hypothetical protein
MNHPQQQQQQQRVGLLALGSPNISPVTQTVPFSFAWTTAPFTPVAHGAVDNSAVLAQEDGSGAGTLIIILAVLVLLVPIVPRAARAHTLKIRQINNAILKIPDGALIR